MQALKATTSILQKNKIMSSNKNLLTEDESKFLSGMIEHHKMALVMCKDILPKTENDDIMWWAYSILYAQMNEINSMQQLLGSKDRHQASH